MGTPLRRADRADRLACHLARHAARVPDGPARWGQRYLTRSCWISEQAGTGVSCLVAWLPSRKEMTNDRKNLA